jgi:hypothetical protein
MSPNQLLREINCFETSSQVTRLLRVRFNAPRPVAPSADLGPQ